MIYLDNAATTYPKPQVVYDEMDRVNRTAAVNTGRGSYKIAREMTEVIDETREQLCSLFNAKGTAEIVFTPSVTHAINQIVNGLEYSEGMNIYISPYEHNAVARTLAQKKKEKNFNLFILPVTETSEIDLAKTKYMFLQNNPDILMCIGLSNVTGYILPYGEIFGMAKSVQPNCRTILDAAQAAGLIKIDIIKDNIDITCFAGHKTLYGPFGIAGFAIKNGVDLAVTLTGGTGSNSLNKEMPNSVPGKYEAGSPNITAIAGLNASLKCLDVQKHYETIKELTNYATSKLSTIPNVHMLGINGNNLGIISLVVEGYSSGDIGMILDDEYDIAVRTGYHCAPDIHSILDDIKYGGTVRIGLGMFNTTKDIDCLVEALRTL